MSLFGNLFWFLFGGEIIFVEYILGGLLLCLTVVGIPFGVQCFKLAVLGLAPFGRRVDSGRAAQGFLAVLMNIVWLLFGGLWIAATHLILALICAVTVIGLPFAKQHAKMAGLALTPFGRISVRG